MKALSVILMAILLCSCAAGQRAAKIATGVAVAYGIHEAGHEIAARATNTAISWKSMEYTIGPKEKSSGLIICASGLTAQQLSSEVIIRVKWKNDYTDGMMIWNTVNPIAYSFGYWLSYGVNYKPDIGGFHGDTVGIEYYSNEETANVFSVAMVGLSLWNAYRYWWADKKPVSVGFAPVNGGASLIYSRKF
jgi:hypothetical protein